MTPTEQYLLAAAGVLIAVAAAVGYRRRRPTPLCRRCAQPLPARADRCRVCGSLVAGGTG